MPGRRLIGALVLALVGTTLLPAAPTSAVASVPQGFVATQWASGLTRATQFAVLPDGRVLVAEQGGTLEVVDRGTVRATPMLSLSVDSSGERGLIGVAVDPDYTTNRAIYVHHTVPGSPPHTA